MLIPPPVLEKLSGMHKGLDTLSPPGAAGRLAPDANGRMTITGRGMRARVLIVDDDATQRSDLVEIVSSLGFEVATAAV